MSATGTITCTAFNHLDLVWRRCWARPSLTVDGQRIASAQEAHALILDRAADLIEAGGAYEVEQALSLRAWLHRRPERLAALRRWIAEGRCELLAGGEVIIDVNLCAAETMLRNLASGLWYATEVLGQAPARFATHRDGFGSCAQFPQALRQCGLAGVADLAYRTPDRCWWRGLDGSVVRTRFDLPTQTLNDFPFLFPCPACAGAGCAVCAGSGMRHDHGILAPIVAANLTPGGALRLGGEELVPSPAWVEHCATALAAHGLTPRWTTFRHRSGDFSTVPPEGEPCASAVENNPTQTGCYASRSRVKRATIAAEAEFYAAEAWWAVSGGSEAQLESAWLDLTLLFHHDAVTGTHTDAVEAELLVLAASVRQRAAQTAAAAATRAHGPAAPITAPLAAGDTVAVFNPFPHPADLLVELPVTGPMSAAGCQALLCLGDDPDPRLPGQRHLNVGAGRARERGESPTRRQRLLLPAVPPLASRAVALVADTPVATAIDDHSATLGDYRLDWDQHGLRAITHTRLGRIADGSALPIGLPLVERDLGDPWGTRSLDQTRTVQPGAQHLVAARRHAQAVELIFAGELANGEWDRNDDPFLFGLAWQQRVLIAIGQPWVEVELEVSWNACHRRLRVAFPSAGRGDDGRYAVPGGSLLRPRYEKTGIGLSDPSGDWPIQGWVATLPDGDRPGLAVCERGTPSVRIEDGTILISVLRSPGFEHCLKLEYHEACYPVTGMRDGGHHRFHFALLPHAAGGLAALDDTARRFRIPSPAVRVADAGHCAVSGYAVEDPGIDLAAVKPAHHGLGLVLRLMERSGVARTVTVAVPPRCRNAELVDGLERPLATVPISDGRLRVPLHAWGWASLHCS